MFKSENFALTFSVVWLLVRAVTGGASDGYGKNQIPVHASTEPEQMNQKPNKNFKYLWLVFYLFF
jgi:hypothetical protein